MSGFIGGGDATARVHHSAWWCCDGMAACANAEEASAEYRLGKGFELTTTFGDAGVGGVYLFWTKKN